MKKLRFDWLMLFASVTLSATAAVVLAFFAEDFCASSNETILFAAMFFSIPLFASMVGIFLVETYRGKNYVIQKKGNRLLSILVAAILSFSLGAGAQTLYPENKHEKTIYDYDYEKIEIPGSKKEKTIEFSGADISVLLDLSASMSSNIGKCKNAVCDLINEFETDDYFQIIGFADAIINTDSTDMYMATDENKNFMKEIVTDMGSGTGTMFDSPLDLAYDSLMMSSSKNKAVIMVTDGSAYLSEQIKENYINSGIPVYVISISSHADQIEQFVKDSGGYTVSIDMEDVERERLLGEFREIYEETVEEVGEPVSKIIPVEDDSQVEDVSYRLMFYGNDGIGFVEILIRFLTFLLYSILASVCMYYTFSKAGFIVCLLTALIATLLSCFISSCFVMIPLFVLAFWIAMTRYYPST